MLTPSKLLPSLEALAREAGALIMSLRGEKMNLRQKADASPITAADEAAHKHIVTALATLTPNVPIISEENTIHPSLEGAEYFWLVDPLDGTRSFVRGGSNFTVNIALMQHNKPVLGLIYLPVARLGYSGIIGQGAWREGVPIQCQIAGKGLRVLTGSRDLSPAMHAVLSKHAIMSHDAASSSLKFCRVAEGAADFYPRLGTTMEWDTAAGHAIVEAAGGCVLDADGHHLRYRKESFRNHAFFVWGERSQYGKKNHG
jgi:3'(2'), 5'-bisphosphate nucleotidase